jgi:hypothetical protein
LFDDKVYEVDEILRSYYPEWKGEGIDGGLVVELGSIWPGENCYRAMGKLQVKDWFWVWSPYDEAG